MRSLFECRDARIPASQGAQPAPPARAAQASPPAIPPSQTEGRPAECLMTVNGKNYIDGGCRFDADPDGSFRVFGKRYFAYVNVTSPGIADASWNFDPPTSSAQAPLGELRRNGACWESPTVRICAWQTGQRPPQTPVAQAVPPPVQAAPPPGSCSASRPTRRA